jgi:phosphate transport system protein
VRQFENDLDAIKEQILTMAGLTEKSLDEIAKAVTTGDLELARTVIARDDEIDRCELEIDRLGTEFIVRHQPLASDLRFVVSAIKIAPGLERVADNAVNIASYLIHLGDDETISPVEDIPRILGLARAMVATAVAAFVTRDSARAREVIQSDDEVDRLYWQLFDDLMEQTREQPAMVRQLVTQILVARFAERIGDQAENIAEEIIYLVEGEPVRHADPFADQPPEHGRE